MRNPEELDRAIRLMSFATSPLPDGLPQGLIPPRMIDNAQQVLEILHWMNGRNVGFAAMLNAMEHLQQSNAPKP